MREVLEDEAAALVKGNVRGLVCAPSARGLGDGDGRAEGGTAEGEGEGGRRSAIPILCSDVKPGIFNTSRSPGVEREPSLMLPLRSSRPRANDRDGVCTVSITATDVCRVMLGFRGMCFSAAAGPLEPGLRPCNVGSRVGAADRERVTTGGVSTCTDEGPRRDATAASSECVNWCELREAVEIVDTLECVGDIRSCILLLGVLIENAGGVEGWDWDCGGVENEGGGNWKPRDEELQPRSKFRSDGGESTALLLDRWRFAKGFSKRGVEVSGEEAESIIGGASPMSTSL